jgi:hypothetical protein
LEYELINENHLKALNMRQEGKTYKEIGKALKVSPERASQMVSKATLSVARTETQDSWTYGLNKKLANSIISAGFKSKPEIVEALNQGKFGVDVFTGKSRIPGVSHINTLVLAEWAGVDILTTQPIQAAIKLLESHGFNVSKP